MQALGTEWPVHQFMFPDRASTTRFRFISAAPGVRPRPPAWVEAADGEIEILPTRARHQLPPSSHLPFRCGVALKQRHIQARDLGHGLADDRLQITHHANGRLNHCENLSFALGPLPAHELALLV